MLTRDFLSEAFRHMEWADATVWAAVPPDEPPDPRLRYLLVHIHTVQRAFLSAWTAAPLTFRAPESFASLADVHAWGQPVYGGLTAFLSSVDESRLHGPFAMPWATHVEGLIGRPAGPTTLAETCFQVTSHSTYHRGQVNARLRELGAEPPPVDYIAWIWFGRPAPSWPGASEATPR